MACTMNGYNYFRDLIQSQKGDSPKGIFSICSAHPLVLETVFEYAVETDCPRVLIEATANQVNQFGGYTGMTPALFRDFVLDLAEKMGFPTERLILGGDHLGPLVWQDRPAEEALRLSEELIRTYVEAGFVKIHLDTSMPLGDDSLDSPIADELIARRGARLCRVAEETFRKNLETNLLSEPPLYVIGSEVPTAGGSRGQTETKITSPEDFLQSFRTFKSEFISSGLQDAFDRVVAFVVQPGVEFSSESVVDYDSNAARDLCESLKLLEPAIVFEGHSTDYQTREALRQLVEDGIAILKVGPALTFALREGLFALEKIEEELYPLMENTQLSHFSRILNESMLSNDQYWIPIFSGSNEKVSVDRIFSYSDRTRYYLPVKEVAKSIEQLFNNLEQVCIPETIVRQYLPHCYSAWRDGLIGLNSRNMVKEHIKETLRDYNFATS